MSFEMPERFKKIIADLRAFEPPKPGDACTVFDLSRDDYRETAVRGDDPGELCQAYRLARTPLALIVYNPDEGRPELEIEAWIFSMTIDLASQKTTYFHVTRHFDLEQLKAELKELAELLKSEAS